MAARPPVLLVLAIAGLAALAIAHSGEVRTRASAALASGMPPRERELARGFILGDDEGIDPRTVEDFRRSGLSHLLAVSGQNVALLALLATPLLAVLGIPLRLRLFWLLALIAAYVPLAGAGPSIQRAGVMGALSLVAAMTGRRTARLYALGVAAAVTLSIDPGIAQDAGWQLSFAAVLGILALAPMLRAVLAPLFGRGPLGRALAEAAALTIAATVATAPLIALHFRELSTTTLAANLLAAPAVAPAMWLGMLAAAAGQVPGLPVEPLNWLNSVVLGYIAQIASWCGRPPWACLQVDIGPGGVAASYGIVAAAAMLGVRVGRRRRLARLRARPAAPVTGGRRRRPARALAALVVAALLAVVGAFPAEGRQAGGAGRFGLRVTVLDVGQGDAILLQPRAAPAVLVDGGPPGDDLAAQLRDEGVERLGAVVATHDQSDHVGGLWELLGQMRVDRLVQGVLGRRLLDRARESGVVPEQVAAGEELRSGRLRLEVLWPPRELLGSSAALAEPNGYALVLLARWRRFSMLLTADAEAEVAPLDVGPLDVLKVAHHGSDDAGLAALLERSRPRLAVISVGDENPFGHPTPATLATLAAHRVPVMRTDLNGSVAIEVGGGSMRVGSDH
jgi:competence protein ComEC